MFRISLYILALVALLTGLIIGTLNSEPVQVDLFWWQFTAPLGGILVLAFVTGILSGIFALFVVRVMPLRLSLRKALKNQARLDGASQANEAASTKDV